MSRQPLTAAIIGAVAIACAVGSAACGGYSARLEEVRVDARTGALEQAMSRVDALVVQGQEGRKPQQQDLPLLLLERAALHQAMGAHSAAASDFAEADQMLEVLDLTPDRAGSAATYLFSESRSLYRPPVYEKLMVNVMALTSLLAEGNIRSAMVEARRIRVLNDYFDESELGQHPMIAASWYIAGIAMELGGQDDEALGFYLEAYARADQPGLPEALVRIAAGTRRANDAEVVRAREALGLAADAPPPPAPDQEVIAFVYSGMAPYRVAERLPIGVVFAWMRMNAAYSLGRDDSATYGRIVAEGLLTWVNYPVLQVYTNALTRFDLAVDGRQAEGERMADIGAFAIAQWEHDRPGVAWAAITRAIVRVVAREAVQAVGNAAGGAGRTIGFIAGLAAQGAMQAADTPDTRTWSLMPATLTIARAPVQPGAHNVRVAARGGGVSTSHTEAVNVRAGGVSVVTVRFFH